MEEMKFKAIVFDFDGVLAESVSVKGDAFYDLYAHAGAAVQDKVLAYHLAHGGVSRFDKIRYYEREFMGCEASEDKVDEMSQKFSNLVEDKVVASDWVAGARQALGALHVELPLFVASATPQEELERIIERRDMAHYFQGVYGSPTKKAIHLSAILQHYQWRGDDVLMIGDTISDYNAAEEAGTQFLGRRIEGMDNPFPEDTVMIDDMSNLVNLVA